MARVAVTVVIMVVTMVVTMVVMLWLRVRSSRLRSAVWIVVVVWDTK